MADLLLGLDVGTTATKALAFDLTGSVVASASCGYGLLTPQPGWVEQEPAGFCRAVAEVAHAVLNQLSEGDRIVAIAQSSQGGTTIPVDADGHPIYQAISWMDQRAAEQAEQVKARYGGQFIYTTTGWPVLNALPLQHIVWIRQHLPDCFAATHYFLFVNDFIGHWLTGELCMNPSDASITQLMSVATGDWDERLLDIAGIRRDQLSPIRPSGHVVGKVTAQASQATGLPEGVPVVNGAHDQYCAAVGTGVMQPGKMLLSCGTAWVLLAVVESRQVGLASGMAVGHHAMTGRWGAMRSLGGVGTALEWLLDNVWGGRRAGDARAQLYDSLNAEAGRCAPGVDGLLFYPMAGGHAHAYGPARGGFAGLTLSHTRGDLARAVMEGTAYELRWTIEEIRRAGVRVSELRMVGGAANSPVWPQIVADVTDIPVTLPAVKEAASRGAAILAGVGVGLFADAEAGFAAFRGKETCLEPLPANVMRYDEAFAAYQRGAGAR
jgi:xylulokinase